MKTVHPRPGVVERHLRRIPLFGDARPADLEALAAASVLRLYEPGDALFHQGDAPVRLFCLVNGTVRMVREPVPGRTRVLHIAEGPATVAEVPVMLERPFPASAICSTPCTVVVVPRATLLDIAARDPSFPFRLIASAMARLRQLTTLLVQLQDHSACARVAAWLSGAAHGRDEIELPAAKKDIAALLGLKPESFSRALARLRQAGAIEVDGPLIRVVDEAVLRATAGEDA